MTHWYVRILNVYLSDYYNLFKLLIIMRFFFFCIISFCLIPGHSTAESAQRVVAVQGIRIQPFMAAINGFKSAYDSEVEELFVAGMNEVDVKRKVNKINPDIVLAIGTEGLSKTKRINDIPIIYLMVLNPTPFITEKNNIQGISIHIPYEKQLDIFKKILPEVKRIGVVYHQDRSALYLKKIETAAGKMGIRIVSEPINNSKEVPSKIMTLKEKVDAFWMLPDISVITPKTTDFLLFTSFKHKIPILSFSEKYVKMGALVSVGMDPFDIGLQAGEIAKTFLNGKTGKIDNPINARKAVISINLKIAEKFGILVDQAMRSTSRIVD